MSRQIKFRLLKPAIVLAGLLGIFFGIGFYTFGYSKGLSYLSSDPAACANCHIMQDQYSSWQKGTHHTAAVCVECHLPHEFIPKMIEKAEHGWRHSKAFTLQNFHEPIQITGKSSATLQQNCLRCHGEMLHGIVAGSSTDQNAVTCVHCHQGVGHGARQ